MISIREVARLAGVSPATVSRVLNGTANVDGEKKKRVLDVIEETGFKPNQVARSLFKKSSKMIGVILPNTSNSFFTELIEYIEGEAFIQGYKIIICYSSDDSNKEIDNLNMLLSMNADGIILLANDAHISDHLKDIKIPIVVVDRNLKFKNELTQIASNHYKGGVLAVEHLIKCGCKNIVNMNGPMNLSSAKSRFEAYIDTCKKYNLEIKYVNSDYNFESGIKSTKKLLEKFPNVDGIVASNDIVAISVYKVLSKRGYRIPEDIMIVGFDNIRLSSIVTPEITTIEQPIKDMGIMAVKSIVNYKNNIDIDKKYVFDTKLIKRETTYYKEEL